MNVKELRIGNIIKSDEFESHAEVLAIYPSDSEGTYILIGLDDCNIHHYSLEGCEAIPLTEEWLERLGFTKVIYKSTHDDFCDEVCYELENREFFMSYEEDFSMSLFVDKKTHKDELGICPNYKDLRYVHQLQNLYFALTGEELELNNDK